MIIVFQTKDGSFRMLKMTKKEYRKLWCGNCKTIGCKKEKPCELTEDYYLWKKRNEKKW